MKYFEILDQYVFFKSLESKVLQILPNGENAAWLFVTEANEYVWCSDYSFPVNILENYTCIREQMGTKSLFVFWSKNKFRAKLVYKERVGGYKETYHEVCFASASGHSVEDSLNVLNEKLREFNPTDCLVDLSEYPILQFSMEKSRLLKK